MQALYGRGRVLTHSLFNPFPHVNRKCNWFANGRAFSLNMMDITTLSFSVLDCLEHNWLCELIKLKVNCNQPCRMLFLCCGKMIWDKWDTPAHMSVLVLEIVEASRIRTINWLELYSQCRFLFSVVQLVLSGNAVFISYRGCLALDDSVIFVILIYKNIWL